jgi:plasmid rolling circle replication initiator protein Rep
MRTEVKRCVQGFHRAIEITYNAQDNTYHPHVHAVIAVPSRYFATSMYIKRDRWLQMWQESTRIPQITQVDIRAIKSSSKDDPRLIKAFSEACKYSVKEWSLSQNQMVKIQSGDLKVDFGIKGHIWIRDDLESSAELVVELRAALYHRRLVQFGGIFRDIKRELKLESAEESDGDLVHIGEQELGCQCKICSSDFVQHLYIWNKINRNYIG